MFNDVAFFVIDRYDCLIFRNQNTFLLTSTRWPSELYVKYSLYYAQLIEYFLILYLYISKLLGRYLLFHTQKIVMRFEVHTKQHHACVPEENTTRNMHLCFRKSQGDLKCRVKIWQFASLALKKSMFRHVLLIFYLQNTISC